MTKEEMMKSKNEFDFEKDLSINKFKLDEECLSHAGIYFRYADACNQAKLEVSRIDDKLKLVLAERNIAIREELEADKVKTTEALITANLEKDSKVLECKAELRQAQVVYSRLQVAVSAMETRKSGLDNLVKLYVSGYFSTPSTNEARKGINEQTSKSIRDGLNKE